MDAVLEQLKKRIDESGLSLSEIARNIGVTQSTLQRHLAGAYVRSDSLAKYRLWLEGDAQMPNAAIQPPLLDAPSGDDDSDVSGLDIYFGPKPAHARTYRVVDLFSGCGGLSLGFDMFDRGEAFRTVLALDIEPAMVRAFNHNHPVPTASPVKVARRTDLAEFFNEAEVLAFYLSHLADLEHDADLRAALNTLPVMGLTEFQERIASVDRAFCTALADVRSGLSFRAVYRNLASEVLGQTSVIGFHDALKLPRTSSSTSIDLGPVIWSEVNDQGEAPERDPACPGDAYLSLRSQIRRELELRWVQEVNSLRARESGTGRGQLASSSQRIGAFTEFLDTPSMQQIRDLWLDWRSNRDALRFHLFTCQEVGNSLRKLYREGRRATVVLGGPPCQGFSRIGRGKIRSLREDQVHAHYDEEAGDIRNRLLHKYVLFVAALVPDIFLFENVAHFKSEVKTPTGTYLASEVLADAMREISDGGASYQIAHRIVTASDHFVPQSRERFFMVGLHSNIGGDHVARWCLSLPRAVPIPLRAALEGLPRLISGNGKLGEIPDTSAVGLAVGDEARRSAVDRYRAWIEQDPPASLQKRGRIPDAQYARAARRDDAAFFELLGPGKRWMDYRCDGSKTLAELQSMLAALKAAVEAAGSQAAGDHPALRELRKLDATLVQEVENRLDGSLSLRLLLEAVQPMPGEHHHHLATKNYLAKRDGNHGDWLARLHPDKPCKSIVTHMGKDTYAYVHPWEPRTLSVREAARVQTFPDWFSFGELSLVDGFRVIGNAVPPLLSNQFAERIARILWTHLIQCASARE